MRTSWSCGHATHNQDWDLISESWNRFDKSDIMVTCSNAPTLLEWSRMTSWSQLIYDKSDSIHLRTEECKNHSYTLKLKNSEVIFINGCQKFGYMSLNSSWKIKPNGPLCGLIWGPLKTENNLSKNNWLCGVILILLIRKLIST